MITIYADPVTFAGSGANEAPKPLGASAAGAGTMAYAVLDAHNAEPGAKGVYRLRFDSLISHDITYVGIIQTARASGLKQFPVPYALTNCHNSLCAVGGTINEDDHVFGLSAAKKYGGVYVPANLAVLHQYAREMMSGAGKMILGSDSHTRYGALGAMGIGEGGPEVVKQLLSNTYDIAAPEVVLVYLTGSPKRGVGPHDVAIALCGAVYDSGFAKNKVLEFAGPGIQTLPMDFRIGIDVMTTETACLSSIWETDEQTRAYYAAHGREDQYRELHPAMGAAYHGLISIDLSRIEPMIAMPFHPSRAYTLREANAHAGDILAGIEKDAAQQFAGTAVQNTLSLVKKIDRASGRIRVDQGVIAGCAGGMYGNIQEAAAILSGGSIGAGSFSLSIYPPSAPVNLQLIDAGIEQRLMEAGALFKPCFCGPCFGAGDVPANNSLSIRHTTRNFPNREGSRPADGQLAAVALMDARSIAATARAGGLLTGADEIDYEPDRSPAPAFNQGIYQKRVYNGFNKPHTGEALRFGPNIADWPKIEPLGERLLLRIASVIRDPVTTTDELIPSGETSSYRSNPLKLAEFTLSRRDPAYVGRAKAVQALNAARKAGMLPVEAREALARVSVCGYDAAETPIASAVFAMKPGDGSAREQAASCQRVLGGGANISYEYATKRYRSNLINWGILPFTLDSETLFLAEPNDWIYVPHLRTGIEQGQEVFHATLIRAAGHISELRLYIAGLTPDERKILLSGCLINYYAQNLDR
jgi:aconitate hydratase